MASDDVAGMCLSGPALFALPVVRAVDNHPPRGHVDAGSQGLTLVHFPAQRKHLSGMGRVTQIHKTAQVELKSGQVYGPAGGERGGAAEHANQPSLDAGSQDAVES